MENKKIKRRNTLTFSLLLLAATFAAGFFGAALLTTTMPDNSANASISAETTEASENIATGNNNNTISLAEKSFLVEEGKTIAATPINQTHIQISLAGNGTITLPNSTEIVKTKDIGNAIARLTPTGNIAQGQIHISTEDASEKATLYFTEIGQNEKGIGVAYFITNSTGKLAFLNNMVAVIQDEVQPNGNTLINAWEWRAEDGE